MRALVLVLALLCAGCEWSGIADSGNGSVPPDPAIAVSPDWFVETTNQGIAVWDRLLTRHDFRFPVVQGGCFGDARIYYDPSVARWYLVTNNGGQGVCLSVSTSADPTGAWYGYLLPAVTTDHPTLAWGASEVIVTQAFGSSSANWILQKNALLTGSHVEFVWFRHVTTGEVHAVHSGDETGFYTYAVEKGAADSSLFVWRFHDAPPSTVAERAQVNVETFGTPVVATQGTTTIAVENTLYDALLSDDETTLYVAVADGPGVALRVFELHGLATGWPPTRDSATLYATAGRSYTFGSLGTDAEGFLWVGATCADANLPLSLCLDRRGDGDNDVRGMTVVKQGTTMYLPGQQNVRAGDYTTLARDAGNRKYLYFAGQLATDPSRWRTWIMQVGSGCDLGTRRCA